MRKKKVEALLVETHGMVEALKCPNGVAFDEVLKLKPAAVDERGQMLCSLHPTCDCLRCRLHVQLLKVGVECGLVD